MLNEGRSRGELVTAKKAGPRQKGERVQKESLESEVRPPESSNADFKLQTKTGAADPGLQTPD